jgi:hypothetical protein
MKKNKWLKFINGFLVSLLVLVLGQAIELAYAVSFDVTLDTSSFSGTDGQLAFDLIDGDGANNNTAIISSFSTDGTLGSASSEGGVSGDLPGPVNITDTALVNELLQEISLGSSISFRVDLTTNFAGGVLPDSFSFFLLDSAGLFSLVTTDLLGDALFTIDIDGTPAGVLTVAGLTEPSVPLSVTAVPEPSSLLLVILGLSLVVRHKLCRVFLTKGGRGHFSRL